MSLPRSLIRQTQRRSVYCTPPSPPPHPRTHLVWPALTVIYSPSRLLSVPSARPARRHSQSDTASATDLHARRAEFEQAAAAAATSSLDAALLYITPRHSNAYLRAELRGVLDHIERHYIGAAPGSGQQNGARLKRSHAVVLLKAAENCSHPHFAVRLVTALWPPPRQQAARGASSSQRWSREMEHCYALLTDTTPSPWPLASPELLTDYLIFLRMHSFPLLPSMITPAQSLYKHHGAWPQINEPATYCLSNSVPIPRAAYPLFLVAANNTRNHQQALLLLAHARANIPRTVALEQWYPIFHAAIDAMGACGEHEKAMQIVQYMREQGMELTAITYTAAINALCKANDTTAASSPALAQLRSFHDEVKQRGITRTQPLYRALIRAYMHFDAQDEAIALITHFMKVHHDPSTAFFMLAVSVEVDNVQAALLILDNVAARLAASRSDKWRIQLPLYNRVLELVTRQQRWDALRTVWGMRAALQVSANITSYYSVAQGLDRSSRSWAQLQARVMELLHWHDGGVLDVRRLTGESTVRAAVWWAVKAVELGWQKGGEAGLGLDVLVSEDRRAEVLRMLDEMGLSSEVGTLEVRVRAAVMERWLRSKRGAYHVQHVAESGTETNGSSEVAEKFPLIDNDELVQPPQQQQQQAAA
ncbi:hypothetical protein MMC34_008770 [Xylographa carneopallida]|nr:hypothetical protein [Xylographa carneopallida]